MSENFALNFTILTVGEWRQCHNAFTIPFFPSDNNMLPMTITQWGGVRWNYGQTGNYNYTIYLFSMIGMSTILIDYTHFWIGWIKIFLLFNTRYPDKVDKIIVCGFSHMAMLQCQHYRLFYLRGKKQYFLFKYKIGDYIMCVYMSGCLN